MEPTQELTTAADRTPAVITTPDQYTAAMKRWEGRYNVLTPFTAISGLAASHGIIVSQIKINSDPAQGGAGEVYGGLPFLKGEKGKASEEVALAKIGLRKLAECAAISTSTTRTDDRRVSHYWEFKAVGSYRGIDGSIVTREATVEWDLRDGSDRLKGWTANQISEGRKNGLRNAEARAINAAIRECGCGIKQKYTRAELEKPFIVLRVAFQPDMSDPDIKRMVTQQALGGTRALYGAPAGESHHEPVIDAEVAHDEPTPRHIGSGTTPAASSTPATPDPDQPPCEGAVRIVEVNEKSGVKEKLGEKPRPWKKFEIVDHLGAVHSTFDTKIADFAKRQIEAKAWVEIVEEQNGPYTNLIEILPAGENPPLPGMEKL